MEDYVLTGSAEWSRRTPTAYFIFSSLEVGPTVPITVSTYPTKDPRSSPLRITYDLNGHSFIEHQRGRAKIDLCENETRLWRKTPPSCRGRSNVSSRFWLARAAPVSGPMKYLLLRVT